MAIILFYSPFNQRSRDTESLMIAFLKQGHKVFSLSQQEGHQINDFLNASGVIASSFVLPGERSGWWYYLRHLFFFVRFCWRHDVKIVYSHLEPANFVAALGQYLIRAKTYICRHHIDEAILYQFDKDLYYRVTYRLARKIIVVSNHARKYMIERERIPAEKIIHINLAYNFDLYDKPDKIKTGEIRKQFQAELLFVSVCRLTPYKRPEEAVALVKKLLDHGLDIKLVLLGIGEMQDQLRTLILTLNLQERVFMPGYVNNVLDFMGAADFLLHPSLLDSSCVAVKEAGLAELPVIVCQGVGDFDDYIVDGENGFKVAPDKYIEKSSEIIRLYFRNKNMLNHVGANLRNTVLDLFSIENVIGQYDSLNKI